MTKEEKLEVIADILEVELDELAEESELATFDAWDSLAMLAVISEIGNRTGEFLHASDILKLKTVGDVMSLMGE